MAAYLLKDVENPKSFKIGQYRKTGGYKSLPKALAMSPEDIIDEVKSSGLRGRGGAGFPTGMKWSFAAANPKTPKFLICNADEGEPGTFKDKPILEKRPHLLIEGMVISAYALGAEMGYIYLRGEYPKALGILEDAIAEARKAGFLGGDIMGKGFKFDISVHRGAGAYICGEETALLNSIEGRRGQPRIKPPFPVNIGLFSLPTVVNNVETLSNVPYIVEIGSTEYKSIGQPRCTGPKLFCISGHVERPGVYELPMGTPLREIIYGHAGGMKNGAQLKAVIPGGISAPVLPPSLIDIPMDFDSLSKEGSMLGSGAIIVMDETTCMVRVCLRAMEFYEHESCGKCSPCREGIGWLRTILERMEAGDARKEEVALIEDIAGNIAGKTFCPLGDGAAMVLKGFVRHFRDEFERHAESPCPGGKRPQP